MDKSYVTMSTCPICKEPTGTLLLDRRLKERFDRYTVNPTEVCDKCQKKYLKTGVMLINPHTGRLAVIKISAFKRIFDKEVPEKHIAFVDDEVLDKLGIES